MRVEPTPEPLYIDLLRQYHNPRKVKRLLLPFAMLVPALYLALLAYEFSWTSLGMGLIFSANAYFIYSSGSGKDPLGVLGKNYISIDERALKYKKRGRKSIEVLWQEVEQMQLHLFSADFRLKSGQTVSISLEQLSDENLQLVKERLRQAQV